MADKRALLLRALEQRLVPVILQHGFEQLPLREEHRKSPEMRRSLPFGYFRRINDANYELLEIQLDKRGKPAFVLNFGVVPPRGVDLPWGHFDQESTDVAGAQEAYRLHNNPRLLAWFSVSSIGLPLDVEARTQKVVDHAVAVFPEVENWFATRTVGPHMRPHGYYAADKLRQSRKSDA